MAQQVSSTIDRTTPRHSTDRSGTRRPSTRRPEVRRPARGPRVQRTDRGFGFEARGAAAGCQVRRPARPMQRGSAVPSRRPSQELRLTDRGIAVILTLGAILGLIAVFCIVTTGLRVTAEPTAPQAAPAVAAAAPALPADRAGSGTPRG